MINRLYLLGLLIALVYGITFANIYSWKTYTNMYDIRDMVFHENEIWCATNGGVFKYSTLDSTFEIFTNLQGLSDLDVRTIAVDSDGDIWIGTFSGLINLVHLPEQDFELIDDYRRHVIYDISVLNRDSLLIAFDNGIGLYVKSDREVKENYYSLGKEFEARVHVNKIHVDGNEIWAATDIGIAKTSLDKINLNDPESWTNYTTKHGLPGKQVRAIQVAHNTVYAITDQGIAKFDTTQWTTVNNGLSNFAGEIYSFFEKSDTLFATGIYGVYRYEPQRNHWYHFWKHNPVNDINWASVMCMDNNYRVWVGRWARQNAGGIAYNSYPNQYWNEVFPPGPPSNKFNDAAVDKNGNWWCATTDAGVLYFDGIQWRSFNAKDGFPSNDYRTVAVDGFNQVWAGSAGGGLTKIDENFNPQFYRRESLAGPSVDPNYIIIFDVKIDNRNNVWVVNRETSNNAILSTLTPENNWYHFTKGITNLASNMEIDNIDRIWVGTDNHGLYVLDYNNTLEDYTDDNFNQGYNQSEGLWSNQVTALKEDLEGTMWIGTDQGLNYWYIIGDDARLDSFYYNIISNNIKAIEVDAQNNVWVGTGSGISLLPATDRFRPQNFTTQNSPLVNDEIIALTFDKNIGDLLICTPYGLSVLETGLKAYTGEDFSQFQIYPNPFRIDERNNRLYVTNLAFGSKTVKIYTINGALVKNIPLDDPIAGGFGGQAIWDGRNDRGEQITSGIYLVVVVTEDGKTHLSKVAVIRE